MKLYLVQHGEAKKEEEDPSRPLTEKGFKDAEKVAKYVSKLDVKIKRIFHSGKLRAKQTAEIYANYLNPEEGVFEAEGLNPLDDVKIWVEKIKLMSEDIMLTGHLPHLSKLTSALIVNDENIEIVKFRMAGVVCLERDKEGKWAVLWVITPEVVP
ncbi:phosphohistidine phosphatase SixA [Candidatus Bathyarchaeota archaeon]|nr:MAG: phosphohistidine phosphatase SixA [Candidatus Bathyarchaeota archaeon]